MIIKEGLAKIEIPDYNNISKEMPVFYNPLSSIGRDIAVEVASKLGIKNVLDPMSASGIRGIRYYLESNIREVHFNDINPIAIEYIKKNLELNNIKEGKIIISNLDARAIEQKYEYIDIDPFGSATPYLYLINNTSKYLAITYTDTAVWTGEKHRKAYIRYNFNVIKTPIKHEIGVRGLVAHLINKGAEIERALIPIYAHSAYHYYRVYMLKRKGSNRIEKLKSQIGYLYYCPKCYYISESESVCPYCKRKMFRIGPLYLGKLWAIKLDKRDYFNKQSNKIIERINEESEIDKPYYYELPSIAKALKTNIPPMDKIMEKLKELGYKVERTHFSENGIRTNAPYYIIKTIFSSQ